MAQPGGSIPLAARIWSKFAVVGLWVLPLGLIGSAGTVRAAEEDSTSTFFGKLGIHPNYTTGYTVNRTSTSWDQHFDVSKALGGLKVRNNWKMGVTDNSAQNNSKRRDGTVGATVEYGLEDWGGWSSGGQLQWRRAHEASDIRRTVDNESNLGLFLNTELLGRLCEEVLSLEEETLAWNVGGSTGITSDRDVRDTNILAGGRPRTRSDSTHASGSDLEFDSDLQYQPRESWSIDLAGRMGSSREDSHTESFDPRLGADSLTILDLPNRNENQNYSLVTIWEPDVDTRAELTAQHSEDVSQSFNTTVRAQDTRSSLGRKFGLKLSATPLWGVDLELTTGAGLTDVDYDLQELDDRKTTNNVEAKAKFTSGSVFGPLEKTEVETKLKVDNSQAVSEAGSDLDTKKRSLQMSFKRALGRKLGLTLATENSLEQALYLDRSQDNDQLRSRLDGTLSYTPGKKVSGRLTGQWNQRQTINIPSSRSINSNTETIYLVGGEVNCQVTTDLRLTQIYTITAIYSVFDFNEASNGLTRTTEVRTSLGGKVGSRVKLDVSHRFNFLDSGQYLRAEPTAPRLYNRAREDVFQSLSTGTGYAFSDEFEIHATQILESRVSTVLATERETRTKRVELTAGASLNHDFSEQFKVSARADRTESSAEKAYWRVNASLNRRF